MIYMIGLMMIALGAGTATAVVSWSPVHIVLGLPWYRPGQGTALLMTAVAIIGGGLCLVTGLHSVSSTDPLIL